MFLFICSVCLLTFQHLQLQLHDLLWLNAVLALAGVETGVCSGGEARNRALDLPLVHTLQN